MTRQANDRLLDAALSLARAAELAELVLAKDGPDDLAEAVRFQSRNMIDLIEGACVLRPAYLAATS